MGSSFSQIGQMLEGVGSSRLGACLDTCHIFAAGYDLRSKDAYEDTFKQWDEEIGLDQLHLFHLNDSLKELGCKVDRHAQIGEGFIGYDGFRYLVNDPRFKDTPGVLETPPLESGEDSYKQNLGRLREMIE